MPAVVSLLRGINVGGHHQIKMDALRELYTSIGLLNSQTHIQSGNVIFLTKLRDIAPLAKRIEDAIEKSYAFRPSVMVRTAAELREVVARNPFAKRKDIHPSKLLVSFLGKEPTRQAREKALAIPAAPEELHIVGREAYIYYLNGLGLSKLPMARIEKALETSGTARNWNTVTKLLAMAEELETPS